MNCVYSLITSWLCSISLSTSTTSKTAPIQYEQCSSNERSEVPRRFSGKSGGGVPSIFLTSAKGDRKKYETRELPANATRKINRQHTFDEKAREDGYQKREATEHPYSVYLQIDLKNLDEDTYTLNTCSGSLISPEWVLTAAHCVADPPGAEQMVLLFTVHAGYTNASAKSDQVAFSREWRVHPNYSFVGDITTDDLALVRLPRPFRVTDYVAPIGLRDSPWDRGYAPCSITAFGNVLNNNDSADDYVRKTHELEVGLPCDCETFIRTVAPKSSVVCARPRQDFGVCAGDSGGGLVRDGRVAGVVSYMMDVGILKKHDACDRLLSEEHARVDWGASAVECGDQNTLSVFQDVYPHLAWIRATANLEGGVARSCVGSLLLLFALIFSTCGVI